MGGHVPGRTALTGPWGERTIQQSQRTRPEPRGGGGAPEMSRRDGTEGFGNASDHGPLAVASLAALVAGIVPRDRIAAVRPGVVSVHVPARRPVNRSVVRVSCPPMSRPLTAGFLLDTQAVEVSGWPRSAAAPPCARSPSQGLASHSARTVARRSGAPRRSAHPGAARHASVQVRVAVDALAARTGASPRPAATHHRSHDRRRRRHRLRGARPSRPGTQRRARSPSQPAICWPTVRGPAGA